MTNFGDLAVLQKDSAALKNFWHVTNGLYIWEYFTTLDFELDFIRGRRPYRWTIWIYLLARTALLISIIINFIDFDVTTPMNCQVVITLQVAIAYLSQLSASLLVLLRIVAIWNKNKFAVAFAVIAWLTNFSIIIQGITRLRATWNPLLQTCIFFNTKHIKPTFIITLINDTMLFVTMLVGLYHSYSFGLGRLLWKQGIIWLLVATVGGIPPVVFICLNLNVPFNVMFLLPSVITNTIAATRIYRALANYALECTKISLDAGSSKSDIKVWNNPQPIPLNRIEVAVDTAYEQTSRSVDSQQGDKPRELSVGSDLECAIETSSDLQIPAAAATVRRSRLL